MSTAAVLAVVIPLAFASGINVYATVAVIGLAERLGLVALPAQFAAFGHDWVIASALALYVVEFVADKVPWVDSAWDALHTVVRPIGGALVSSFAVGSGSPDLQVVAALLGGSVALTTHLAKAGTRVAVNASPEPFTNWAVSLLEDVLVVGLTWVALQHPYLAAVVASALLVLILAAASKLISLLRRRMRG